MCISEDLAASAVPGLLGLTFFVSHPGQVGCWQATMTAERSLSWQHCAASLYTIVATAGEYNLAVQMLSTVPTIGWVLLGSGESNKG